VKVQFKFRDDAADADRDAVLEAVESRDGTVEPLFPDPPDGGLASLFVADVPDGAAAETLELLERSPAVEFAEPEVERRLIRPVRDES
jgi:hypothetical protein